MFLLLDLFGRSGTSLLKSTTVDILSWKFSPRPHSMLDVRTQSMDTNFYPNTELGGRGNFFQHLSPRLQPWIYCLGNFPCAPVQCWMHGCNWWTQISTPTLNWGEGGIFSNIWDQGCSCLHALVQALQIFDKWFRPINEGHTNKDIVLLDNNVLHCMFLVRR